MPGIQTHFLWAAIFLTCGGASIPSAARASCPAKSKPWDLIFSPDPERRGQYMIRIGNETSGGQEYKDPSGYTDAHLAVLFLLSPTTENPIDPAKARSATRFLMGRLRALSDHLKKTKKAEETERLDRQLRDLEQLLGKVDFDRSELVRQWSRIQETLRSLGAPPFSSLAHHSSGGRSEALRATFPPDLLQVDSNGNLCPVSFSRIEFQGDPQAPSAGRTSTSPSKSRSSGSR